jgi:precorrin-2 dehydrogenase / sirohydrochlorin ferrochelatase
MIPIHLNPELVRVGLVGNGKLALRRFDWLVQQGCTPVVWSTEAEPDFAGRVGPALMDALPDTPALKELGALWIADLPSQPAHDLAQKARNLGVLVNVEDDLGFCDFHTPAIVQRGALTVSIGTGGASPAAAGVLKRIIEAALPPAWEKILAQLGELRTLMRKQGAKPRDVILASQSYLSETAIANQIAPCEQSTCPLLANVKPENQSL